MVRRRPQWFYAFSTTPSTAPSVGTPAASLPANATPTPFADGPRSQTALPKRPAADFESENGGNFIFGGNVQAKKPRLGTLKPSWFL